MDFEANGARGLAPNAGSGRLPRGAARIASGALLLGIGVLLAVHVGSYAFLTDDAYISFRYARNLVEGHGLVFNPGDRPVEGYTNFLWVVLLAAGLRTGISPEHGALMLGCLSTLALWLGTAWFGWRYILGQQDRGWWWVAPLALAANRSFAVWATSGLETRLFELLALAGLAVLWREMRSACEASPGSEQRRVSLGATLLALATLTRPDALVIALGAGAVSEWLRWRSGAWRWRAAVATWLPFVLIVGIHEVWRLAYYGDILPNTYYAKFGGQFRGSWGILFLTLFAIEYALVAWIPLVAAGCSQWRHRAPGLLPVVAGGLGLFVAYVVYAGGDHFEYRQIDVVWLPLALLLQSGTARLVRWRSLAFVAVAVVLGLSAVVPTMSRGGFTPDYRHGVLGAIGRADDGVLVRVERLPRLVRPLFEPWFAAFNTLSRRLSEDLIALRQEEHAHFIAETTASGLDLRDWVARGILPDDTRIAINCVGAIPYYSRLWTLDRIGLCDRTVARMPASRYGRLGHLKMATPEYLALQRVDLEPVTSYNFFVSDAVLRSRRTRAGCSPPRQCWTARLGPDLSMLVRLPLGIEHARGRFPSIPFEPVRVSGDVPPVPEEPATAEGRSD